MRVGTEDVRKKAWQLVQAKADGHEMSPGVAELIDELAATLNQSAGWEPGAHPCHHCNGEGVSIQTGRVLPEPCFVCDSTGLLYGSNRG